MNYTKLPDFKCSLVTRPLKVIANSEKSICITIPDRYELPENERSTEFIKANYGFNYRGKAYFVNHLHLICEAGMIMFKTEEYGRTYAIIPGGEVDSYVAGKFIYGSELSSAGKVLVAKKLIDEINQWFSINKEVILSGFKEEGRRRNEEEVKSIKEEINKLEQKKNELEAKLRALE